MRWLAAVAAIATALVVVPVQASVAALVPASAFTDSFVVAVASPTAVEPLDGGRAVVLEQDSGRVRIIDTTSGQLFPAPAAQLGVCAGGERGLLGFTSDPTFSASGRVDVFYTRPSPGAPGGCVNRVSAFVMSGNTIDVASEQVLIDNISSVNVMGQGTREEMNDGFARANYGWNAREGRCPQGQ